MAFQRPAAAAAHPKRACSPAPACAPGAADGLSAGRHHPEHIATRDGEAAAITGGEVGEVSGPRGAGVLPDAGHVRATKLDRRQYRP